MTWLIQYIIDFMMIRSVSSSIQIVTRPTSDGDYFWGKTRPAKIALRIIRKHLLETKISCHRARFGGIFIPSRYISRQIYEGLMHEGGLSIATLARMDGIGPYVVIVDTCSPIPNRAGLGAKGANHET